MMDPSKLYLIQFYAKHFPVPHTLTLALPSMAKNLWVKFHQCKLTFFRWILVGSDSIGIGNGCGTAVSHEVAYFVDWYNTNAVGGKTCSL